MKSLVWFCLPILKILEKFSQSNFYRLMLVDEMQSFLSWFHFLISNFLISNSPFSFLRASPQWSSITQKWISQKVTEHTEFKYCHCHGRPLPHHHNFPDDASSLCTDYKYHCKNGKGRTNVKCNVKTGLTWYCPNLFSRSNILGINYHHCHPQNQRYSSDLIPGSGAKVSNQDHH